MRERSNVANGIRTDDTSRSSAGKFATWNVEQSNFQEEIDGIVAFDHDISYTATDYTDLCLSQTASGHEQQQDFFANFFAGISKIEN